MYDTRDWLCELAGVVPSHTVRLFVYRHMLGMKIGAWTSVHRHVRAYYPPGVSIGQHSVINRDVLLDGRAQIEIGDNVSISEGAAIFTLEHDLQSPDFANRGAPVRIADRVFVGARAIILPGVELGEGAAVGAGAVVTRSVPPYTIVAGVPATAIGQRQPNLTYNLQYRKFLG